MTKNIEPYVSEMYYYIGESNELFTCGKQYKVVEVDYHWDRSLGKFVYISDNEYFNTRDIDYCSVFTLNSFYNYFMKY